VIIWVFILCHFYKPVVIPAVYMVSSCSSPDSGHVLSLADVANLFLFLLLILRTGSRRLATDSRFSMIFGRILTWRNARSSLNDDAKRDPSAERNAVIAIPVRARRSSRKSSSRVTAGCRLPCKRCMKTRLIRLQRPRQRAYVPRKCEYIAIPNGSSTAFTSYDQLTRSACFLHASTISYTFIHRELVARSVRSN